MRLKALTALSLLLLAAGTAQARDTSHKLKIAEVLAGAEAKVKLDPGIALYFGPAQHGEIAASLGEFQSNKKTNAFNKSDEEACRIAFLSAVIALQERARKEGGNAVVNITSYYKKNTFASDSEYECGAGALMAGVTFKGTVVKLK